MVLHVPCGDYTGITVPRQRLIRMRGVSVCRPSRFFLKKNQDANAAQKLVRHPTRGHAARATPGARTRAHARGHQGTEDRGYPQLIWGGGLARNPRIPRAQPRTSRAHTSVISRAAALPEREQSLKKKQILKFYTMKGIARLKERGSRGHDCEKKKRTTRRHTRCSRDSQVPNSSSTELVAA